MGAARPSPSWRGAFGQLLGAGARPLTGTDRGRTVLFLQESAEKPYFFCIGMQK
jgi:hypothetical protein